MATHRHPLLNHSIRPNDSNCWLAPYATINSATTQNPVVLVMDQGVASFIAGCFRIPENYVGTPLAAIVWTSETTTGDVHFGFRHRVTDGNDTELLDISTTPTERSDTTIDVTGPSAASEQMITTISLTTTDLVAGSLMYFEFERDGVGDTKADVITIWDLSFQYNDA